MRSSNGVGCSKQNAEIGTETEDDVLLTLERL